MSDRGTVLFIVAQGLGSKAATVNISLNGPSICVGGSGGFSDVPAAMQGDPYAAVVNFTQEANNAVAIGGLFGSAVVFAFVNVPSGDTISGSVQVDPALTGDLKIQSGTGGSYTLPAGQTSGNFSFPFDASQPLSAAAKTMPG